jgi:alkanesulfonate monooxygenase SsuD/methylene tetrahydromethanopterin reductase-like flavin-dependent oxidoreductase (luciferase family)
VSASGPSTLPDRLRDLDEACRAAKRDPKTLLRSAFLMACVGKTRAEADRRLDQLAAQWKTDRAGIAKERPGLLIGTAEDAAEKLRTYAGKGIGHANIMFQPYGTEREQIAALAGITSEFGA